jgi:hypothetical protein
LKVTVTFLRPARVEVDDEVGRVGGAGTVQRDGGVGEVKFRYAARCERIRIRLVGDDAQSSSADGGGEGARIDVRRGSSRIIAQIADDARDIVPIAVGGD